MAKLRNVQFLRNSVLVDSRSTAITKMGEQLGSLKDGELIIGRYTEGEGDSQVVRSVLGVAYINASGSRLEIIPDNQISDIIKALANSGETIAAKNDDGVVTIYKTITEANGIIKIDTESESNKINLAKVATTGKAVDVTTATVEGATYTTSDLTSQNWKTVVEENALATTDDVEASVEKLDTKIAGLADELIADEQVIKDSFKSVKEGVGLNDDFTSSFENALTAELRDDTSVKQAIYTLESKLVNTSNTTIDGHKGNITTGNGITDVTTDSGSFAVKAKDGGYISVTADGVDVQNVDTTGTSTTESNIATVKTVNEHIKALDVTDNIQAVTASTTDDVITLTLKGTKETDGKIEQGTGTDTVTFAKVAKTGESSDVAKSTNSTATYDVTASEISNDWKTIVNGNKLEDGDSVDVDLNKLDNKIAGLADELISDENVINNTFDAIQTSVGLSEDFTLDITGTNYIDGDNTNVKAALITLDDEIKSINDEIDGMDMGNTTMVFVAADNKTVNGATIKQEDGKVSLVTNNKLFEFNSEVSDTNKVATMADITSSNLTIDGKKGAITTGDGLSDVTADNGSFGVVTDGYVAIDGTSKKVVLDSTKIDSNYTTANTTNLATVATVTAALDTLDNDGYAQASIADGNITINGIKEENGKIETDTRFNTTIAYDGTYNATDNKLATQTTVKNAIDALDAEITSTDGTNVQVKVTETDGKITAVNVTDNTETNLKLQLFKTADGTAATTVSADGVEYALQQGGTTYDSTKVVAKFNIEKDSFVRDGSVVSGTWNGSSFTEDAAGTDHALKLEIRCTDEAGATTEKTVYININDLYDNVTYTISWSTEEGHTDEIKLTPSKGDAQYIKAVKSFKATGDDYITVTSPTATSGDVEMTVTHKASGVTAGSYGESTTATKDYAGTINVPRITVDAAGHITAASDSVITLPSRQTASDALTIAVENNVATISDTLTVDGTAQTASSVKLKAENGLKITADGTDTAIIAHNTQYSGTTATDTIAFADDELSKTLSVPVLTIDNYGHVTANAQTTYTITLPESIATAVQTVQGKADKDQRDNLNNLEYVNVKATKTGTTVELESSVQVQSVATATAGGEVWTEVVAHTFTAETAIDGTVAIAQRGGVTDQGTWNTVTVNGYTYYIIENTEQRTAILTSLQGATFEGADKTTATAAQGLAEASDVKNYVDSHEPQVAGSSNVTVTTSMNGTHKVYTVSVADAQTTTVSSTASDAIKVTESTTATGKNYDVTLELADKAHVGDTTAVSTVDGATNLLKVDADGKLSMSDTWDCGTF